jgi:hypothetical protein
MEPIVSYRLWQRRETDPQSSRSEVSYLKCEIGDDARVGSLTGAKLGGAALLIAVISMSFRRAAKSVTKKCRSRFYKLSEPKHGHHPLAQDTDDPVDLLLGENERRRLFMPAWLILAHNPSIDPSLIQWNNWQNVR